MSQKVYVLINEAMPNLVKIGKTSWPLEQRIADLSRASWVPLPFEVFYAAEVDNMDVCEKLLHQIFMDKRINPRREFFTISPEQVASAIKLAEIVNITPYNDIVDSPEEQKALDEARKKRENFNFKMVDIPIGSTLYFIHDELITCIVLDNKKVLFDKVEMSLTWAAKIILESIWKYYESIQWPVYWLYERETLNERRMRFELWEE